MQLDPVENNFRGDKPWRTLLNLYWPERRWVALAMVSYLFKASPLWVLPVVTAHIIDIIAHRSDGGMKSLLINAAVGAVAILQNIASAAVYVNVLSRAVRNVEIRLRSALVRRLQMLSIGYHSRSAELHSAVARIFNPLRPQRVCAGWNFHAQPNAIRRYSRVQLCATAASLPGSFSQTRVHERI